MLSSNSWVGLNMLVGVFASLWIMSLMVNVNSFSATRVNNIYNKCNAYNNHQLVGRSVLSTTKIVLNMLPPPEDCESEDECEIDWGDDEPEEEQDISSPEDLNKEEKDTTENNKEEAIGLTSEKIAEMIEVSFVNACMQLAQGYVDVLKLFIVGAKAGYENGITIPILMEELSKCPVQSANRPLMEEEENLRSLWVNLVYLTLGVVKHSSDDLTVVDTIDESTTSKYTMLVSSVVKAIKKSNDENINRKITSLSDVTQILGDDDDSIEISELQSSDAMQNAILGQSIKLIGLTMTVLEEEQICFESGGQGTPPRPPIPGAF